MGVARKAQKRDPLEDAAVEYFSGRSHDAWRKQLLRTNPEQRGQPRMRMRGGVMVDINQPWSKLDARAKEDNRRAARDAFAALKRFPKDREAASDYIHRAWIRRNKGDKSQPKELFKPYAQLPEVEKDKDRAHVDRMKKAIAAVSKSGKQRVGKKTSGRTKAAFKVVRIDAGAWRRLERAAGDLSKLLGREVAPEALLAAGAEAVAAVAKAASGKRN
jgi:hypothetical protein